jgi:hypothetical protein
VFYFYSYFIPVNPGFTIQIWDYRSLLGSESRLGIIDRYWVHNPDFGLSIATGFQQTYPSAKILDFMVQELTPVNLWELLSQDIR